MKIRSTIVGTLLVATVGAGALALAPAAGAQSTRTPGSAACARAHDAWQRIVAADAQAVAEYRQLRAKEQQLIASGHEAAAHRLDTRLDAAQRRHEALKAKVLAIAAKVRDRCTEQPPSLPDL